MAKEYIEKEAAIKAFKIAADEYDKRVYDIAVCAGLNTAIRVIKSLPAADVRENVKSAWVRCDKHIVKCHKCGNFLDMRGVNAGRGDANFCPNCGAQMGGAEDD